MNCRKMFVLNYFVLIVFIFQLSIARKIGCPCKDRTLCVRTPWPKVATEAFVVTTGNSSSSSWDWTHINLVLAWNHDDPQLSCDTKNRQKKFGFIVDVPTLNTSADDFKSWLQEVNDDVAYLHADALGLDLLKLIDQCDTSKNNVEGILNVTSALNSKIKLFGHPKFVCIMPWKPPCYDGDCQLTVQLLNVCDFFVTSPDSYITSHEKTCRARATVPKAMMLLGLEEYLSMGVLRSQILSGIPWHGYEYSCSQEPSVTHPEICYLNENVTETGSCKCNYDTMRKRLNLDKMMTTYSKEMNNPSWDGTAAAPYFNYKDKDGYHQVWFESMETLIDKYDIARMLDLHGVVIWTADDVSKGSRKDTDLLWGWMLHTLFFSGKEVQSPPNFAGKAAAIGVGCLLLGVFLGFLITCIIQQKRIEKIHKKRKPFELDMNADEFHDDVGNSL